MADRHQQLSFDVEQAVEILQSVNRVSGLGTTLFVPGEDGLVEVLHSEGACAGRCPHCPVPDPDNPGLLPQGCQRVHCAAARCSDRFGGRYFYQCDEDRIFFSAPIVADGGLAAAMTVGPVHIFEPEGAIAGGLRPFPVRSPAYIQYLSNLLCASAVSVSDSSQSHLRLLREASLGQQSEIHSSLRRHKGDPITEYPILLERELTDAICKADVSAARVALNELLGTLLSSVFASAGYTLAERAQELITVCARAALSAGVASDKVFEAAVMYRNELRRHSANDQVSLCLLRFVEHMVFLVSRLQATQFDDDMYRATEYIRTHYNEKITLNSVADEIGYSPAYFSRLFKKKMGINFNAYLNEIRIEASKNSLLSTNLTILEIARLSGFEDVSYFTRIFKRLTGVAPGSFRAHRGQIDKQKAFG